MFRATFYRPFDGSLQVLQAVDRAYRSRWRQVERRAVKISSSEGEPARDCSALLQPASSLRGRERYCPGDRSIDRVTDRSALEGVKERESVHTSSSQIHNCGVSAHRGRMCRRIVAALHDP